SSPSVNQCLHFPAEFHIYLSGANVDNNSYTEFWMIDAVACGEPFLHRIGAERSHFFSHGNSLFFRTSGRSATCGCFWSSFTIDMIAATSAAFDTSDRAVRVDRSNDMLPIHFAFSTISVYVAPDLRAFDNTKRIFQHSFDSVSILN